ncbi:MAG: GNAT family N-acetyltransferase [Rhodobacter sp.]|nr:GNAT family N-acetyltransferase [Rhodobacter sp.]
MDDRANTLQEGQMRIRAATLGDADLLVRCIDLASEGVLPAIWAEMAPAGVDPMQVGQATVLAEEGQFSHRFAHVIEADAAPAGAMISLQLPAVSPPPDPEVPEIFRPIEALEHQAPEYWYINVVAVLPEAQGRGLGAALLRHAEALAREAGAPGVALIVAASNEGAMRFYRRLGFSETARCPFDVTVFGMAPTEAVLMTKSL